MDVGRVSQTDASWRIVALLFQKRTFERLKPESLICFCVLLTNVEEEEELR